MLEYIEGDVFDTSCIAIAHGVNTKGVMGAGVAKLMRQLYPYMNFEYARICHAKNLKPGGLYTYHGADNFWIYNLATQEFPGPNAQLPYVASSVELMCRHAKEHDITRIAMPRIGCGIGGLTWEEVEPILAKLSDQYELIFEIWTLPEQPPPRPGRKKKEVK